MCQFHAFGDHNRVIKDIDLIGSHARQLEALAAQIVVGGILALGNNKGRADHHTDLPAQRDSNIHLKSSFLADSRAAAEYAFDIGFVIGVRSAHAHVRIGVGGRTEVVRGFIQAQTAVVAVCQSLHSIHRDRERNLLVSTDGADSTIVPGNAGCAACRGIRDRTQVDALR